MLRSRNAPPYVKMPLQGYARAKILAGRLSRDEMHARMCKATVYEIFRLAQDFFQLIQEDRFTEPFDLIVGNPPFGSEVAGIARDVEQNRTVAGVTFPALPDRQLCYLFLREMPQLLGPEGTGCLILKDGFLYNLNAQDFRTAFLHTFQVPQILDFVSIRHLFKGKSNGKPSDAKVVAVFFENRPPDEKKALLHATFRKVRSVQDQLGFELDAYDFHWLPRHVAREEPLVWKADLLGGGHCSASTSNLLPCGRSVAFSRIEDMKAGTMARALS
jgi:hypothetical protein